MAKTSEAEWAKIIIKNWKSFGKTKISKEDIYSNPKITDHCNIDDFKMSGSRKSEHAYRQQIGNIISHRNKNFNFLKISKREYLWPKKLPVKLKFENELGSIVENKKSKDKIIEAIKRYETQVKLPQRNKTIKRSFISSMTLKNALKVIHEYACEFHCNMEQQSFKKDNKNYVEVHHVVPLKNQGNFKVNLDIQNNLIVLCPKHHKMFHYGEKESRKKLINSLPKRNKDFLKTHMLTIEKLLKLY